MATFTIIFCFLSLFGLATQFRTRPVHDYELSILHSNDFQSRFEEIDGNGGKCTEVDKQGGKCFGGVARMKAIIQYQRNMRDNVLVLDAGDQSYGTPWFYFYGDSVVVKFMNLLGYDAMALGGHEFDNGVDGLVSLVTDATFPILSANLDTTGEPRLDGNILPSKVFTVGGKKIGVVGYTSPSTDPGDTLSFSDDLAAIQREVDKLIGRGVDKIIALGHSGFDTDIKIAKNIKGVDIVVGGKDNMFLYNGTASSSDIPDGEYPYVVTQNDGTKVLVVQAYKHGKYMGVLKVSFDSDGKIESWDGNPVLLDDSIPQDASVVSQMLPYIEGIFNRTSKSIGSSYVPLTSNGCCKGECNLGNVIADALQWKTLMSSTSDWNAVSMAVMNCGGIKADISPGDITFGSVIETLPRLKHFAIIELRGRDIVDMFEYIAEEYKNRIDTSNPFGGFLQVSGIKIRYNLHRPAGKRVDTLLVRCHSCAIPEFSPIDKNKVYPMAVPNYIGRGRGGFRVIRDKVISFKEVDARLSDALAVYLTARSPIITGLENRITLLPEDPPCEPCWGNQVETIKPLGVLLTVVLLTVSSIVCFLLG